MPREQPLPFDPIAEARANWERHGFGEPDVMAAVTSITRVHQILIGRINRALAPHRLTFARYEALVLLTFSRQGRLPLGKMGERLQVHPASVTNAIDRLEADGYVERVADPRDGRRTLAGITREGRAVVASATRTLADIRFGADGLDDATARRLSELLRDLRRDAGDF